MNYLKSDIEELLIESVDLIGFLTEKQYQLSNIGLTDAIAHAWTKAGVYIEKPKKKGRRKYNAIEYVWLRLVVELREFGFPIKAIVKLKSFLLTEVDFKKVLVDILIHDSNGDVSDKAKENLRSELKANFDSNKALQRAIDGEGKMVNTILTMLIYSTILAKVDSHLLIKKDGACFVYDEHPFLDSMTSAVLNAPYISFPLRHIVSDFINREDLYDLRILDEQEQLSTQEKQVLKLLREGGISSLNVRLANGEIKLIETEEFIDVSLVGGKLFDLIKQNAYQEIQYKTENGKIVSLKRKTKYKN